MNKAVGVCVALSVGLCVGQTTRFFEHKTSATGVPFAWPSTWSDLSQAAVERQDVFRLLVSLTRNDVPPVLGLQSFRFVPLEKEKFYMVASVDFTGRGFFNGLEIIHCERANCSIGTETTEEPDLDADLVDVNGDGVFEVITKELPSPYVGMMGTVPVYTYSIRSLINGDFVDVSSKYPEYFQKHILPRMEVDRRAVDAQLTSIDRPRPLHISDIDGSKRMTPDEEENMRRAATEMQEWKLKATVELQYVQDDYHRRVLGEKTAGLDNALKWARSDNRWVKEFGVKALEPIDSPTAAAELLRIANLKDSPLAEDARHALNRRAQARLAPPPTGGIEK